MKKNPLKWMMIAMIVLLVVSIAMQLFWNKKINLESGEVGYFGTDPKAIDPSTESEPTATVA